MSSKELFALLTQLSTDKIFPWNANVCLECLDTAVHLNKNIFLSAELYLILILVYSKAILLQDVRYSDDVY